MYTQYFQVCSYAQAQYIYIYSEFTYWVIIDNGSVTIIDSSYNPRRLLLSVGAGSAGSVLARRLSERDDFSVLILEAGGESSSNTYIDVPLFVQNTWRSDIDWNFITIPQKVGCKGKNNSVSEQMFLHIRN